MANTEKIVVQVVVKGQKELDNLGTSTGRTTKSFGRLAGGVLAAVTAFRQITAVVSAAIKSFRDFEFQMAKVRAITGANEREFKKLESTALKLGRTTFFTATQVAALQTNYGKLGFTTQEILDAQQATIDLATATGSDLARAAIVAGASVRGFGLDASETGRVVDVMAVAFTSSALDIEKWQTSMTKVAPIAKSAGFSIEDTAAIMAQLADSGIEASIAGTSLRNILLKMQDPTSDLTKSFGKTIHSFDELLPAMRKFVEEGGSMADIMEVVDLRQAAAFEQMLTSADSALTLRDALLEANGAAEDMANIIGDTLEGDLKELTSAWEGFQISVFQGSGKITESIRNITDVVTALLNKLTDYNKTEADFIQDLVDKHINIANTQMKDQLTFLDQLSEADKKLYGKTKSDLIMQRIKELRSQGEQTAIVLGAIAELTILYEEELQKEQQLAAEKGKVNRQTAIEIRNLKALREQLKQLKTDRDLIATTNTKAINRKNKQIKQLEEEIALLEGREKVERKSAERKKKEEKEDVASAELIAYRLQLQEAGLLSKQQELDLQKELNNLRAQELRDILNNTEASAFLAGQRKAMIMELHRLTMETGKTEREMKDEQLARDLRAAALSGQTAKQAMISAIRAELMEAVAGYASSAFKTLPWPINIGVAAGAAAVVGGMFEKLVGGAESKFAQGGMVHGRSHAQGGEKFAVGGRVVELEGGEAVINKRSTAMFRNQLSAMNAAGGGVKFADGGLLNMPSFSQQQFNALNQNQMMGAMSSGAGGVVVVEADITDSQNTVNVIEAQATV